MVVKCLLGKQHVDAIDFITVRCFFFKKLLLIVALLELPETQVITYNLWRGRGNAP